VKSIQSRRLQRSPIQTRLQHQRFTEKNTAADAKIIRDPNSYAATVSRSLNANDLNNFQQPNYSTNFTDLFLEMISIPNIQHTMKRFAAMVKNLKASKTEQERSFVLMDYRMLSV
jgi:hypothetical protein